jgi:hypothetical protein
MAKLVVSVSRYLGNESKTEIYRMLNIYVFEITAWDEGCTSMG